MAAIRDASGQPATMPWMLLMSIRPADCTGAPVAVVHAVKDPAAAKAAMPAAAAFSFCAFMFFSPLLPDSLVSYEQAVIGAVVCSAGAPVGARTNCLGQATPAIPYID
jgi:hypothetical protein